MKIQHPISSTDSIPILFKCPQSIFICGSECMGSFSSDLQFSSQEFAPKAFQTEFAVCHAFDRKAAFWLKSNLRSFKFWHLEHRMKKKIWQNSFKNLLQKLFKLNLQCFMFSRKKPFFDWMQTVKTLLWHLENGKDKKFDTVDLRHWFEALQIKLSVRHTSETEVTFWLKTNLQSSNLASRESHKNWFQTVLPKRI